jgi:hypothetical protein
VNVARFDPGRALLHVSFRIGSPAILPASVASETPRLDTVIPGEACCESQHAMNDLARAQYGFRSDGMASYKLEKYLKCPILISPTVLADTGQKLN